MGSGYKLPELSDLKNPGETGKGRLNENETAVPPRAVSRAPDCCLMQTRPYAPVETRCFENKNSRAKFSLRQADPNWNLLAEADRNEAPTQAVPSPLIAREGGGVGKNNNQFADASNMIEDESLNDDRCKSLLAGDRLIPSTKELVAHAEQTLANIDELIASLKPTINTINRLAAKIDRLFPESPTT